MMGAHTSLRLEKLDRRDVTHTERDLHARKLVTRGADPDDSRQVLVELTTAGTAMPDRLDLVVDEVRGVVLARLTPAQQRTLVHLLRKLS
jgi:DNA-binding MarR family transcriptional regulator